MAVHIIDMLLSSASAFFFTMFASCWSDLTLLVIDVNITCYG